MKIRIGVFLICFLLIVITTSQAITTFSRNQQQMKYHFFDITPVTSPLAKNWIKTFGGIKGDSGTSVQQTTDGGYIITGYTDSFGAGISDVWLIKTDSNGIEEWNRTYGGIYKDLGKSIQQTIDGGYIIIGYTDSFGAGRTDFWLIKTDSNGIEEWNRTFGEIDYDYGESVQQTSDSGYIITGMKGFSFNTGRGDFWLIKTDSNGVEEWNRTFGGSNVDWGYSVKQTTDGGYIITGITNSFGDSYENVWLIKTDNSGNEIWNRIFGGTSDDSSYYVQQTTDGGYIILGNTWSYGAGEYDVWLIKTDINGDEIWNKTFGGKGFETGHYAQQTNDDGYIIIGTTGSIDTNEFDVLLIKTDNIGNKIWNRTFGKSNVDWGYSVRQTNDKGYIITGLTGEMESNVLLIKTDSQGKSKTHSLSESWFEKLLYRFPLFEKILKQISIQFK